MAMLAPFNKLVAEDLSRSSSSASCTKAWLQKTEYPDIGTPLRNQPSPLNGPFHKNVDLEQDENGFKVDAQLQLKYVFLPKKLFTHIPPESHKMDKHIASDKLTMYLYGWSDKRSTVVAGGLGVRGGWEAAQWSMLQSQQQLNLLGELKPPEIIGSVCDCDSMPVTSQVNGSAAQVGIGNGGPPVSPSVQAEEDLSDLRIHVYLKSGSAVLCQSCTPYFVNGNEKRCQFTVIYFTPPSPERLQLLSLDPLQLDLNSFSLPTSRRGKRPPGPKDRLGDALEEKEELLTLSAKILKSAQLDFSSPSHKKSDDAVDLEQVTCWINAAPRINAVLSSQQPSIRPRIMSMPLISGALKFLRTPLQFIGTITHWVVSVASWEVPGLGGNSLGDLSATIQQMDTRLSQTLSWPSQYSLIRRTIDSTAEASNISSLAVGYAHYIQFYNTLWLIANDVIIGSAFTSFVCENSNYIGITLGNVVEVYTLTSLRELLLWLNDWPGGVKLNYELASVFCDAFLWGTGLWETHIFTPLRPYLPAVVYSLGVSGLLGTTMFFSVASDLLSLLTLHIFVFYLMATFVFRWHLSMLGALFNIFRGKKFNVLRNRVEPAVYEVDQLLLGTILFTLAAFLFPTVLVYYLCFAASRLSIVVMHAALETALAFMNHFPLFAVMLRFKDPARLPGGLQFELLPGETGDVGVTGTKCSVTDVRVPYLMMTNNPIGLAGIFFQQYVPPMPITSELTLC